MASPVAAMDAASLRLVVEQQQRAMEELEKKMNRTNELYFQTRQKHLEVNTQLVQANLTFQNAVTEANKTIRSLRQEKDDVLDLLAEERVRSLSLNIALAASIATGDSYKAAFEQGIAQLLQSPAKQPPTTQQFLVPDLPSRSDQKPLHELLPELSISPPVESLRPDSPPLPAKTDRQREESPAAEDRGRRQKRTNYAEPSLRVKMRRNS